MSPMLRWLPWLPCLSSSSLYQPLDPSKYQIRLIQFHRARGPNPHQDIITYTLSTVSLQDKPKFNALSYVWGDPNVTKPITVNNHTLQVTTNLADGLRCLVDQLESLVGGGENIIDHFRLWVDAICVNQDDVAERNHQVKLMRDVYSSAEHVLAWLGIPSTRGERRMLARGLRRINVVYEAIKNLSYEEFSSLSWAPRCPFLTGNFTSVSDTGFDNNVIPKGRSVGKSWIAVDTLLWLPYWERIWIVQETAFARSLVLFCKNGTLQAHKLELFGDYLGRFQKVNTEWIFTRPPSVTTMCWWFMTGRRINYSPLDRLRTVREHARRLQLVDSTHDDGSDSGWIVSTMTHGLVATDPRDYIYGLLGLSGIDIVPDYGRKVHLLDVYRQYVVSWLETRRNKPTNSANRLSDLFFLSISGDGFSRDSRVWESSWVPQFPSFEHCMVTSELQTASTDTELPYNDLSPEKPYIMAAKLFTYGVVINVVARCHALSVGDKMRLDLLQYCKDYVERNPVYATGIPSLQAFLRVMIRDASSRVDRTIIMRGIGLLTWFFTGDKYPESQREIEDHVLPSILTPLLGYHIDGNFIECFEKNFFPGCDLLLSDIETDLPILQTLMGIYCNKESFQARLNFLWSADDGFIGQTGTSQGLDVEYWQLMETESGLVGLVPRYTAPGDVVCVLSGSSLPVVLRRVGDCYIHIGTCWVLGLMNGEIAGTVKEEDIERFEIV